MQNKQGAAEGHCPEFIWKRPQVVPLPQQTEGIEEPLQLLSGEGWKLCRSPKPNFWQKGQEELSGWEDTMVPLQLEPSEVEYAYARELEIPSEWKGKRILLRFDGVNCQTRVFVDGNLAGEHYGGFVSWDCEITELVNFGGIHRLVLGVKDDPGGICPFHFGGIIRDIYLFTLPNTYLSRFHGETCFDENYVDAELKISAEVRGGSGCLSFFLTDPEGKRTILGRKDAEEDRSVCASYRIVHPLKWDSEHPYLYILTAEVLLDGICVERACRRIGFRQIEKRGNEVFLNGQRLKLKGINHHDIHPDTGRAITHELAERDVRLFKEANINFIRTSHYPPRPDFLDLCDEYGIYVEDETAVAFLGQEIDCRENDPAFTARFMDQFAELIERDKSHPCVILWSLANESIWGRNLALENAYAHQEDPERLTIFSYPITQHEDDDRADIWSMHYAAWEQDPIALVDSFDRSCHEPIEWPVLHDESTHIPCYARADLKRDPGIRDFWGETISRFWDKLWNTKGALGCAIWAGLDDVRFFPSKGSYLGAPWGIIDGWRRKKPEYWHVKKAYSPIRLAEDPIVDGQKILLAVENRFNHTNLSEVTVSWQLIQGNEKLSGSLHGPDVQPGEKGLLSIPISCLPESRLTLWFADAFGNVVEETEYVFDEPRPELSIPASGAPAIEKGRDGILIRGEHFVLHFSMETGLITEGRVDGIPVVTGGPYLHLTGLCLEPWKLEELETKRLEHCALVLITGSYGRVKVQFRISIDRLGLMETAYSLLEMPWPSPRKLAMRVGDDTDSGGYEEVGVAFCVPGAMDLLTWRRKGLWNFYPQWHIGRLQGQARKQAVGQSQYERPQITHRDAVLEREWQQEEKDPVLFGKYDTGRRGTRDFASMKSHILKASMSYGEDGCAFTVLSDGKDSVRARLLHCPEHIIGMDDPRVSYQGQWTRQETGYGSLSGGEMWSDQAGDTCTCHFRGTGCAWISSRDILGGMAEVSVDGKLMDDAILLGVSLPMPGIARGYDKEPGQLVFSIEGLKEAEHTLQITVKGRRTPGSSGAYVFIDHFLVFGKGDYGDTQLIIDNEFNYPELSWGCWTKEPVRVYTGYTGRVYTRLSAAR